jgi:hypothetical protein
MYTQDQIKNAMMSRKYSWADSDKDYELNIVGVRNQAAGNKETNLFDDTMTLSYKLNGQWQFKSWACTTDPGTKAVMEFHNPAGVAILCPGQYINTHTIRLHQDKYEAVCQAQDKIVKVFRDKNRDLILDMDPSTINNGVGINIHHSNPTTESTFVENWSEGCQVFKRIVDFNEFMEICHKAKDLHGNQFTYTLLVSGDIQ